MAEGLRGRERSRCHVEGAECPQRTGVLALRGVRYTQRPGRHINRHLPTHGTKECGWLGSCLGHPSPKSCNYSSSLCLSAPEAGSTSARASSWSPGPCWARGQSPTSSSATSPPPALSQCLSLHQPLTIMKLTCHMIADGHNQPMIIITLHSRHCVNCFHAFYASR